MVATPARASVVDAVPTAERRALSILIVDDDDGMRAVVARAFRGHLVSSVANVHQAVAILDSGKSFDVVVSDVMMPGGTGIDLHRVLVSKHPLLASRLVFVTGGVGTDVQRDALEGSGRPIVGKPFDRKQLREVVEQVAESWDWATLVGLASRSSRYLLRSSF